VAEAGQENIETVHEPKPIQAADTLWGQGRRAMKDLHGPQTQVREGAYAIKVSMSCSNERFSLIYWPELRTDHLTCRARLAPILLPFSGLPRISVTNLSHHLGVTVFCSV